MSEVRKAIQSVRTPLHSPLDSGMYDFESCLTHCSWRFMVVDKQPGSPHFQIIAQSVPFLLHACTNYGRFRAGISQSVAAAISEAEPHFDRIFIRKLTERALATGDPILADSGMNMEDLDAPDPVAPVAGFHLRAHLRWYLMHASAVYDPYRGADTASPELREDSVRGSLLTDVRGARAWNSKIGPSNTIYQDAERLTLRVFSKPHTQVRYHGERYENISTRLMLQCYWGLAEIILMHSIDPAGTRARVERLSQHECSAVVRMACFALNVLENHYHVIMLAPTLMCMLEYALNGPFPGARDYGSEPDDQELTDPPYRFHQICSRFPEDHAIPTCYHHDPESIRRLSNAIGSLIDLPRYIDTRAFAIPNVRKEILQSLDSPARDSMSWIDWYLSLAVYAGVKVLQGHGGVTEYIVAMLAANDLQPERLEVAPMFIDASGTPGTFSVFHWRYGGPAAATARSRCFIRRQLAYSARIGVFAESPGQGSLLSGLSDDLVLRDWLGSTREQFLARNVPWHPMTHAQ